MEVLMKKLAELPLDEREATIARYILTHNESLSTVSVKQFSLDTGISERIIRRFILRLGYNSYSDFRAVFKPTTLKRSYTESAARRQALNAVSGSGQSTK